MSESLEFVGKFIGPDEIVGVEVTDQKTPEGKETVKVSFKDGKEYVYPAKTLPYIITEKASELNEVQAKKFEPIIREVTAVMFEYDVKLGEFQALMQAIGSRVDSHLGRATNYLWTNRDENFVPGFDPMYDVSFLMADKVIKNIPKKK